MHRRLIPLPPDFASGLRQFALELLTALGQRHHFEGKIDVLAGDELQSHPYTNIDQARAILLANCDISQISLLDIHFSMMLDHSEQGIELSYAALDPSEDFAEIEALCLTLAGHLADMQGSTDTKPEA